MRYNFLRFPGGKAKAVTLSYDDGCAADEKLIEVINCYGIKCTFNLNCDILRNGAGLSSEQVKELILKKGHEVAVHGEMHRGEGSIRPIEGIWDVLNCRMELENKYGIIIRGMAYPDNGITVFANDASYDNIKRYLSDLDIVYARTLGGDNNTFVLPNDWHCWMPTAHHSNPDILKYADEFVNINVNKMYESKRYPRLFYMWGHSYEFDRNNNWHLLEEICEILGKKEDTWYATNMEIYEYVNAYNSLVYSANSSMVYNPSLQEIWFDRDGKLYSVKPGATIKI